MNGRQGACSPESRGYFLPAGSFVAACPSPVGVAGPGPSRARDGHAGDGEGPRRCLPGTRSREGEGDRPRTPPGWPGRGTSARGDAGRAHAPAPLTRGPGGRPPRPELGRHHGPSVRPDALRRRLDGVRGGLRAKGIHPLRRPPPREGPPSPPSRASPPSWFRSKGGRSPPPSPTGAVPPGPPARAARGGRLGESPDRTGGGGRRDGVGTPFPPRPTPLPPSAAGREAHAPSREALESGGVTPRRHGPPAGGRP